MFGSETKTLSDVRSLTKLAGLLIVSYQRGSAVFQPDNDWRSWTRVSIECVVTRRLLVKICLIAASVRTEKTRCQVLWRRDPGIRHLIIFSTPPTVQLCSEPFSSENTRRKIWISCSKLRDTEKPTQRRGRGRRGNCTEHTLL